MPAIGSGKERGERRFSSAGNFYPNGNLTAKLVVGNAASRKFGFCLPRPFCRRSPSPVTYPDFAARWLKPGGSEHAYKFLILHL